MRPFLPFLHFRRFVIVVPCVTAGAEITEEIIEIAKDDSIRALLYPAAGAP